jgi:hypothetical protein
LAGYLADWANGGNDRPLVLTYLSRRAGGGIQRLFHIKISTTRYGRLHLKKVCKKASPPFHALLDVSTVSA